MMHNNKNNQWIFQVSKEDKTAETFESTLLVRFSHEHIKQIYMTMTYVIRIFFVGQVSNWRTRASKKEI
jgi:hypothetical protein